MPEPSVDAWAVESWDDLRTWPPTAATRGRLVLAEADALLRSLVAQQLARVGFEVTAVRTGDDALAAIEGEREPAVVMLDVRLPSSSGLVAARTLRARGSTAPLVLTTACPEPRLRAEARALRARLFEKPFRLDALIAAAVTARAVR